MTNFLTIGDLLKSRHYTQLYSKSTLPAIAFILSIQLALIEQLIAQPQFMVIHPLWDMPGGAETTSGSYITINPGCHGNKVYRYDH